MKAQNASRLAANALVCLVLICLGQSARAFEFTLETDLVAPIMRSADRTQIEQTWISAGFVLGKNILARGELFRQSGGNFSTSSSESAPFDQIGEQSVRTRMIGGSLGLCYPDCTTSSMRFLLGAGRGEREFYDTRLGRQTDSDLMWLAEIGYTWKWGNAMTGLSIAALKSDLQEAAHFETPTAELHLDSWRMEQIFKWTIGISFGG